MPENDQYPRRDHDTKKPVTLVLLIVAAAAVALFVYEMSGTPPLPSSLTPSAPNPNALAPPAPASR